jgi:hypothetical protein
MLRKYLPSHSPPKAPVAFGSLMWVQKVKYYACVTVVERLILQLWVWNVFISVSGNVSNASVNASLKSTVKIRKKMLRLLWQTFNIIGGRNQLAHRKEEENLQVSLFARLVLKDTPFAGMGAARKKK